MFIFSSSLIDDCNASKRSLRSFPNSSLTFTEKPRKSSQMAIRTILSVIKHHLSFSYYSVLALWRGVWDFKCTETAKKAFTALGTVLSHPFTTSPFSKLPCYIPLRSLTSPAKNINNSRKAFNITINNTDLLIFMSLNSLFTYFNHFKKSVIFSYLVSSTCKSFFPIHY